MLACERNYLLSCMMFTPEVHASHCLISQRLFYANLHVGCFCHDHLHGGDVLCTAAICFAQRRCSLVQLHAMLQASCAGASCSLVSHSVHAIVFASASATVPKRSAALVSDAHCFRDMCEQLPEVVRNQWRIILHFQVCNVRDHMHTTCAGEGG